MRSIFLVLICAWASLGLAQQDPPKLDPPKDIPKVASKPALPKLYPLYVESVKSAAIVVEEIKDGDVVMGSRTLVAVTGVFRGIDGPLTKAEVESVALAYDPVTKVAHPYRTARPKADRAAVLGAPVELKFEISGITKKFFYVATWPKKDVIAKMSTGDLSADAPEALQYHRFEIVKEEAGEKVDVKNEILAR